MKKKRLGILSNILRGLASYVCFAMIQIRTIVAFDTEINRQGFYGVYGEVSPVQATVYRVTAIFLIMFFVIYGFALWNKKEKCAYLALEKREFSAFDEARGIVKSADFLAEVGVYMLFTVVSSALYIFAGIGLPNYNLKYVGRLLLGFRDCGKISNFAAETLAMALATFTASLTARMWVRSHILKNYRPEEAGKFSMDTAKLAVYIFAVGAGFYLFTPYMHIIGNNIPAIALILSVALPVAVAIAAVIIFIKYFRTLHRRIEFISRFRKMCKAENIGLSKIKRPVLSVIFENRGANFSVKACGKEFECKLISGAKKNVPIIFREDGVFYRIHTIRFFDFPVFKYRTKHSYSFESDKNKIIVVCPKCEMQLLRDGRENLILAGECIGEYRVYDASSFERAVQFGYLGQKK